ncbi:MAG: ATP-dependent Clp protease adaptor ClpS [Planctomycetes bacterium]|nr:ATP-dependent Clp protease adaptor ClpS [Planctomycetota bacterium]
MSDHDQSVPPLDNHAEAPSGATATLTLPKRQPRTRQPRLWNVVLLNDDDHSYEYVIEMMQKVFGHPAERAFQIAKTVDKDGRAVCATFHKELAELKAELVHGFGKYRRIASCAGAMSAVIEPADAGDDDQNE